MTPDDIFTAKSNAVAKAKKGSSLLAPPEVLFGWNGNPDHPGLDLAQYDRRGFVHPREQAFYSADNPRIQQLVEGLTISEETDPIEVFLDDKGDIIVLDGASRCCAIAIIRQSNPDAFKRIRMTVYRGDQAAAKVRMLALNMDDRRENLSIMQVARTCKKYVRGWGWEPKEVCRLLGKPESWTTELNGLISILDASPQLIERVESGELCKTNAFEIAKLPQSTQEDILNSGKKITKASLRRAVRKNREANGKSVPGPKIRPSIRIENDMDWLTKQFVDWMSGAGLDEKKSERIEKLRDRAFQSLKALLEAVQ